MKLRALHCYAAEPVKGLGGRYRWILLPGGAVMVGRHDHHDCGGSGQLCSLCLCTRHTSHPSGSTQHHRQVRPPPLILPAAPESCGSCRNLWAAKVAPHSGDEQAFVGFVGTADALFGGILMQNCRQVEMRGHGQRRVAFFDMSRLDLLHPILGRGAFTKK